MQFTELIEHLAAQLRLPQLAPDASGHCAVCLDEMFLALSHVPAAAAVDMSCELAQVDSRDSALLVDLLRANRLGDGSGASSLSCDAEGRVRLNQRYPLHDLSFPKFLQALERFVNYAEYWQERVARPAHAPAMSVEARFS